MPAAPAFEVIVLAGGKGSRLGELSATKDKPLLPVGNRPMIYYSLKLAQDAGFNHVHVICQETSKSAVKSIPGRYGLNLEIQCHCVPAESDYGTVDALRHIAPIITAPEIIILSCDLMSTISLRKLVNEHIANESSMTALLKKGSDVAESGVPGQKAKFVPESDLIGLDVPTGRLVFMTSKADLEETFALRMSEITAYPSLTISSSLMDAHAYIFRRWVFDYLVSSRNMSMLKAEFVPHVIRKQFSKPPSVANKQSDDIEEEIDKRKASICSSTDIFQFLPEDADAEYIKEMSAQWEYAGNTFRKHLDSVNRIRCYACVVESELCIRGNNLLNFLGANLEAVSVLRKWDSQLEAVHPAASVSGRLKQQLASSCLVAEDSSIADKVTIKRTVIGARCKIEDKAKIFNTLIMDDCNVGENASVQDCIICEKSSVGERCDLKNCIIASGYRVPPSTKAKNEVLSDDGLLLEG